LLACCSINVTELFMMGMRPGEEKKTEQFLLSLEFYPVTWEIAWLAGKLYNDWRQKGHTLALSDVTVAAVALTNGLTLLTDNRKHFPMPELQLLPLPGSTE
jgi:predicted nucleic acid-binding protein